jgi:hypothetical protein
MPPLLLAPSAQPIPVFDLIYRKTDFAVCPERASNVRLQG